MTQVSTETKTVANAKPSIKEAMASVADISIKAKEAVASNKRDAAKKGRAYDIITTMREAGQEETAVLKALQEELGISYPNAYYYTKRVFAK